MRQVGSMLANERARFLQLPADLFGNSLHEDADSGLATRFLIDIEEKQMSQLVVDG
jgi:hypothetical protein